MDFRISLRGYSGVSSQHFQDKLCLAVESSYVSNAAEIVFSVTRCQEDL